MFCEAMVKLKDKKSNKIRWLEPSHKRQKGRKYIKKITYPMQNWGFTWFLCTKGQFIETKDALF